MKVFIISPNITLGKGIAIIAANNALEAINNFNEENHIFDSMYENLDYTINEVDGLVYIKDEVRTVFNNIKMY